MHSLQDHLSHELEQAAEAKLKAALSEHNMTQEEAFSFADYDEKEGEKIGYSNYSYWGSTVRMFFKNKGAVVMLMIMLALILLLLFNLICRGSSTLMWSTTMQREEFPSEMYSPTPPSGLEPITLDRTYGLVSGQEPEPPCLSVSAWQ